MGEMNVQKMVFVLGVLLPLVGWCGGSRSPLGRDVRQDGNQDLGGSTAEVRGGTGGADALTAGTGGVGEADAPMTGTGGVGEADAPMTGTGGTGAWPGAGGDGRGGGSARDGALAGEGGGSSGGSGGVAAGGSPTDGSLGGNSGGAVGTGGGGSGSGGRPGTGGGGGKLDAGDALCGGGQCLPDQYCCNGSTCNACLNRVSNCSMLACPSGNAGYAPYPSDCQQDDSCTAEYCFAEQRPHCYVCAHSILTSPCSTIFLYVGVTGGRFCCP